MNLEGQAAEPEDARRAPVLVLAVGNPSRGDDAIGPELATRLEAAGLPGVEVVLDFQLQVEHSLDLVGRERVIFVDTSVGPETPYELRREVATDDYAHTSHALSPAAVLATYRRVQPGGAPEAWVLAVRGEAFELGAELSASAREHVEAAWPALLKLCARQANELPATINRA